MPQKPTAEAKLAALLKRKAILEGRMKGVLPEVGKRIAIKPKTVQAIRQLAAEGYHCAAIARKLDMWESSVRRYAKDYGITLPKGEAGGPGPKRLAAIQKRREEVQRLLDQGWTQRAIAKALGYSTYTINQDAQYMQSKKKSAS